MLDILKNFKRNHLLNQLKAVERQKKIVNLTQIQTIGVVFEVGSEYDWNVLYYFITEMQKQGKKVNIIGFQKSNIEINYIITHAHAIICREKEDLNMWGIPKKDVIDDFTDKHYDVLIDTTAQPNFFGQYITLMSDASLKITHLDNTIEGAKEVLQYYDFMIESEGEMDMKDYLNNVINYLLMIQK